jgi:hypothetical protein
MVVEWALEACFHLLAGSQTPGDGEDQHNKMRDEGNWVKVFLKST